MSEEIKPKAEVVPNGSAAEPRDPEELSDEDLAQVSGGQGGAMAKSKAADKSWTAMDGYLKQ
jgi:bacteriocin-like protein